MQGGVRRDLPHEVEARTQLAAAAEGRVVIEPQTVVDDQQRRNPPFVLDVDAFDPLFAHTVVHYRERRVRGLSSGSIDRQDLRGRIAREVIGLSVEAGTYGMGLIELVSAVALQRIRDVSLVRMLRDAVEQQVAELWVGREVQARVTRDE